MIGHDQHLLSEFEDVFVVHLTQFAFAEVPAPFLSIEEFSLEHDSFLPSM
jgi:hypothetical protein